MNQIQNIKELAKQIQTEMAAEGKYYPQKLIKQRLTAGRHQALTHYKIPRSLNGQKLGLRKREEIAKTLRVKE